MAFNSGLNPNIVKTAIDAVFFGEYDYEQQPGVATALDSDVFKQDSIDRAAVITEEIAAGGYFDSHDEEEAVHIATVQTGNQLTHNVANYKQQYKIPVEYFEDDLHATVDRSIQKMARNARLTRDKNAFNVFVNGFGTVTTGDGAALFSNSHTTLGSGDTVDNLTTDALTQSSFETAWQALFEQLTQEGTLGGHDPAVLLVAPANFPNAIEITKSELKPGTADNELNWISTIYPGLKVKQSPFLSDTHGGDDDDWFLLSRNHSIYRWERQGLETHMIPYEYDEQDRFVYKARFREVVSPVSWEGLYGSNVA